jgi:hypothetical protein
MGIAQCFPKEGVMKWWGGGILYGMQYRSDNPDQGALEVMDELLSWAEEF